MTLLKKVKILNSGRTEMDEYVLLHKPGIDKINELRLEFQNIREQLFTW